MIGSTAVRFPHPPRRGRLLRRYQRFLAEVRLDSGETVLAHCANPGSMLGVSRPGSAVLVTPAPGGGRKLAWTLETIRVGRRWVGIHPVRSNRVVEEALRRGRVPALAGWADLRREAAFPEGGRADFLLTDPRRGRLWLEVKHVTLAHRDLALFPDAVTERGRRHLERLSARTAAGDRAVLLFTVARGEAGRVGPADGIDPAYGEALRLARARGVELLAHRLRASARGLLLGEPVPVDPGPHRLGRAALGG